MTGLWLALLLALSSGAGCQPAATPAADSGTPMYEQARQKEVAGDLAGALERYRLVLEDHPGTGSARLSAERVQAITLELRRQWAPSPGTTLLYWALSLRSSLVGLFLMALVFGFLGWRAGWFWQWALLARFADGVDGALFRFRSRKNLVHELEARKANPRDGRARYALGVLYFQQRKFALAAEELSQAVALDPDRLDAQYHLGLSYLRLNRPAEAVAPLRQIVDRKPTHGGDASVRLAEAELATGDAAATETHCRAALTATPGDAECRYYLALALDAQGKREEPPALLEEAVRLGRAYRGARRRAALSAARRARTYLRHRRPG